MALKAQAAIFDGITFLLLTTFSASLMFVAVTNYGEQEDAVLRSAHVLNYMQSFMKSVYYVNVPTLERVCDEGACDQDYYEDLESVDDGCPSLNAYLGSISVTDLLKRDLSDPDSTVLDDKYGSTVPAKGKTALRCAAKEMMKSFATAGYKYYIEVIDPKGTSYANGAPIPIDGKKITNSQDDCVLYGVKNNPNDGCYSELQQGIVVSGCEEAVKAGYKVLSVSSPFRVTPAKDAGGESQEERQLIFRVCIWPSNENA